MGNEYDWLIRMLRGPSLLGPTITEDPRMTMQRDLGGNIVGGQQLSQQQQYEMAVQRALQRLMGNASYAMPQEQAPQSPNVMRYGTPTNTPGIRG